MNDHLVQFATVRQIEFLDAVKASGGSESEAARSLGIHVSTLHKSLAALKVKAAQRDPALHDYTKPTPEGFAFHGVSQLVKDASGKLTWFKASADKQRQMELINDAIEVLCSDIKPLARIAQPKDVDLDLINVVPMGDPHFGMLSWGLETGKDFDLKIAESLTLGSMDKLMLQCQKAKTCVILPLGDVFHANDQKNITPGHGHQLDVDGRYKKIMDVTIETFRLCAIRALERHENVIIRFVEGNHDTTAHYGLACAVAGYFHNNPRVTVDLSKSAFWYLKHGRVLIGSTHGDKAKPARLPGVMATDRPEWWGQTRFRYWYTGHVHSRNVTEFAGATCESFRTVAPNDAYASSNGYRSLQDMTCITHHANKGEVFRITENVGFEE